MSGWAHEGHNETDAHTWRANDSVKRVGLVEVCGPGEELYAVRDVRVRAVKIVVRYPYSSVRMVATNVI